MSELIIEIENLSKIFRLYEKPHYRFLDMIGLLRGAGKYREHIALNNISLSIAKGEKVGIIGRNGAGKSTLLRVISGVSPPSSGSVKVTAGMHSLLQIGTGFHPDFTGRENAVSYLAQLGMREDDIEAKVREVISFSELEEYIDQPVKFYSSGMMARLMFSTSTVISPDLLALDEILGVGDAYFATKSFEKMLELASSVNTTVLLVSHDIYSVGRICDRIVWIDGGSILVDDKAEVVINAYEQSIKIQEEARLRSKVANAQSGHWGNRCVLEILPKNPNLVVFEDFYIFNVMLMVNGNVVADIKTDGFFDAEVSSKLTSTGIQVLAEPSSVSKDILAMELNDDLKGLLAKGKVTLGLRFVSKSDSAIIIRVWVENSCIAQCNLEISSNGSPKIREGLMPTESATLPFVSGPLCLQTDKIWTGHFSAGSGAVRLSNYDLISKNGDSVRLLSSADPLWFTCDYETFSSTSSVVPIQLLICFRGKGQQDFMRILLEDTLELGKRGCLKLAIKQGWQLVSGEYRLLISVFKPGYYHQQGNKFYSINDDVYFYDGRAVEIVVTDHTPELQAGTILQPMTVERHHVISPD